MTRVARLPVTALLGTNMFFSGISYAATLPYASLVGVETLGMSPNWFATTMAIGALLGTIVSVALGHLSDNLPDRRVLALIAALAGVAGHGLIYAVPTQAGFFIATTLIMPLGHACFSQGFAYARVYYSQVSPDKADFMITALRTVFTLAWVIVPPVAGWVAAEYDIFNIYLVSSLSYAAVALIFAVLMTDGSTLVRVPSLPASRGSFRLSHLILPLPIQCGLFGLVVMTTALRIMTYTVPLFIVKDLNGTTTDVGLYAAITAATEAPFMILWAFLATRLSKETLLIAAGLVTALFLALASLVSGLSQFFWLLVLNGLGTAALMSINISYLQEAIKGRVGLSTSLMDVVAIAANLLGALGFGVLVSGGDYRFALLIGAAVAATGAAIMAAGNLNRLGTRVPVTARP